MAIGTAAASSTPPANVGVSLSMAEISPVAAKFSDIFKQKVIQNTVGFVTLTNSVIFWGDGTANHVDGQAIHVYRDGLDRHTAYIMEYSNIQQYGAIVVGAELFGKTIRPKLDKVSTNTLPKTVLTMSSGDKLEVASGRFRMVINGQVFNVDHYDASGISTVKYAFTSYLRGTVTQINTDLLEYDRWAVGEED
jgi:hypothetical protein